MLKLKKFAVYFIVFGVLALVAAILFAFAVGGTIALVLMIVSIILNSVGITLLREK